MSRRKPPAKDDTPTPKPRSRSHSAQFDHADREPSDSAARSKRPALTPGLYLVATPIGNARDISLRALDVLASVDVIACEDTRTTGRLLTIHGIAARMTPYHDHNAARARPSLIRRLDAGGTVALVSDAGTPLISDPGYKLVRAAIEADIAVTPIPGPAAPLAALAAAGLPTDRFFFLGFPPPRAAARKRMLAEVASVKATLVMLEAPSRLVASLADMAAVLGRREAVIAREITKRFESFRRGALADLADHYAETGPPKGEIVVVIGPPEPREADPATLDALLREALATHSLRDATAAVAAATGTSRRKLYARALALADDT